MGVGDAKRPRCSVFATGAWVCYKTPLAVEEACQPSSLSFRHLLCSIRLEPVPSTHVLLVLHSLVPCQETGTRVKLVYKWWAWKESNLHLLALETRASTNWATGPLGAVSRTRTCNNNVLDVARLPNCAMTASWSGSQESNLPPPGPRPGVLPPHPTPTILSLGPHRPKKMIAAKTPSTLSDLPHSFAGSGGRGRTSAGRSKFCRPTARRPRIVAPPTGVEPAAFTVTECYASATPRRRW